MRKVTVAALQFVCKESARENIDKAERLIREAAKSGANIILPSELFETRYFCQTERYDNLNLSTIIEENAAIKRLQPLARELGVVLPVSFFERANNCAFNSLAIIDATGEILGIYRKTHIPCGQCYEEKFYFTPGDTGFKVWKTRFGVIGAGICWDQWFPESARCMALLGAEILLFPTAIGSEPVLKIDTQKHWETVMRGHAGANLMPLLAANRVGTEEARGEGGEVSSMTFYGSSFIAGPDGAILAQMGRGEEGFICAELDLDEIEAFRRGWGLFRDRRPEMYSPLFPRNYFRPW